jgi:GST-like protein
MIDLYYWPTPNGHKITIFLEETATPYKLVPINIRKGEQFEPSFFKISPNNRMPAIVDHEGPGGSPLALFESGAILMYLAEKTGKLIPTEIRARYNVIQWLMFQKAGIGPMMGQMGHFRNAAPEKLPYAIERYTNESRRLYGVMDKRLAESEYLGGDYSIADIASYPWVRIAQREPAQLETLPNCGDGSTRLANVRRSSVAWLSWPICRSNRLPTRSALQLYGKKQFERR